MIPEELSYTQDHEWVSRTSEGAVRIGITDYAQQQLGDVVFVQLPEVGEKVTAGQPLGEVESTKSVSDLYAPVAGEVTARNEHLDSQPELVNSEPYQGGWMLELRPAEDSSIEGLLSAQDYRNLIDQG